MRLAQLQGSTVFGCITLHSDGVGLGWDVGGSGSAPRWDAFHQLALGKVIEQELPAGMGCESCLKAACGALGIREKLLPLKSMESWGGFNCS